MSVSHGFFCIDVVVGGVAFGGEGHGAAGPVGAETAGFDAGEVDVPFRFYFVGDGFGEAFDGPFGGAVDGEHGDSVEKGGNCVRDLLSKIPVYAKGLTLFALLSM